MTKRYLCLAAAAAALLASPVSAADGVAYAYLPPAPVASAPGGFAWGGVYAGAFAAYVSPVGAWAAGGTLGFNLTAGAVLVGLEAQAGAAFLAPALWAAGVNARVGVVAGGWLLYVEAGAATTLPLPGAWTASAGAGVEVALGRSVTAFAEAKAVLGLPGLGYLGYVVQGGLNFHLN